MRKIWTAYLAGSLATVAVFGGCASQPPAQSSGSSAVSGGNKVETTAAPVEDSTVVTTGDKIHINDNTLGDIWITELDGVKKNTLDNNSFTADNTFKYYSENGKLLRDIWITLQDENGQTENLYYFTKSGYRAAGVVLQLSCNITPGLL